mgnify:FL=1|jgi:hypothetical protein
MHPPNEQRRSSTRFIARSVPPSCFGSSTATLKPLAPPSQYMPLPDHDMTALDVVLATYCATSLADVFGSIIPHTCITYGSSTVKDSALGSRESHLELLAR